MKHKTGYRLRATVLIAVLCTSLNAFAQEKNCVALTTEGQIEQEYTDAQGKPAKRLVVPSKVVPGTEVIWTIVATNSCAKAVETAVVDNNVPDHMLYVADSAMGAGTDITFSLNGRDYKKSGELIVRDADGKTRAARADEIKSIRWTIVKPLASKANVLVRYRAKLQ